MSSSPLSQKVYEKRSEERAEQTIAEKKKIDEENKKKYAEQQERHEKEVQENQEKAAKEVMEAASQLQGARQKKSEELTRLQAKIAENNKQQQELLSVKGKEEVEKKKKELEKDTEELELKSRLLQLALDESLVILENNEKLRQEAIKGVKAESMEEKKKFQEKVLAKNDELQKQKLATENKLMEVDQARQEEEVNLVKIAEEKRLAGLLNVQNLTQSLALQDGFRPFKQQCQNLRNLHRRFVTEYDDLEPTLFRCDERMKRGRRFEDFDMEDLNNALRRYREGADAFNSEGSTSEIEFGALIEELIRHITILNTQFNNIESGIELFNEEDSGEASITSEITVIKGELEVMAPLIQKFNVIPRQHFAETLSIQMQNTHASSSGVRAAIGGPPVYTEKQKAIRHE